MMRHPEAATAMSGTTPVFMYSAIPSNSFCWSGKPPALIFEKMSVGLSASVAPGVLAVISNDPERPTPPFTVTAAPKFFSITAFNSWYRGSYPQAPQYSTKQRSWTGWDDGDDMAQGEERRGEEKRREGRGAWAENKWTKPG